MEQKNLPISKLSYSDFTQLLRNPTIFKMKAILGVYMSKMGVSGMIGKAAHEALKTYYGSNPDVPIGPNHPDAKGIAKDVGLKFLESYDDAAISYGKTTNREYMLQGYTQAMDLYFAEEPEYHEVFMCEQKMEAEIKTIYGDMLPLPAVGIPDLVHKRKDGEFEIIDTKFVTAFTDYETEDGVKIVQAEFMYHLLWASKGVKAKRMLFREIKRTKNKDGGPQIRDWAVPFDHEPYHVTFYNLYRDVVRYLSNDPIFLPNLSDPFDGEQAWLLYSQGLISADMSDVEVMHKVRDVAYTSKKFVASRLDSELNKHLLPEEKIKLRLAEFGIPVEPVESKVGASVTQYRFKVSTGVRMSTIKKHVDDIARAVEAKGVVTILAPIPGTSLIGVEVENQKRTQVALSSEHLKPGTLSIPMGVTVSGEAVTVPLDEMPHLLVAGSSGSGKSVLLHSVITALTTQMNATDMELVLIDPKRVELRAFAKVPHLWANKVLYDYEECMGALRELVDTMENRYKALEKAEKRDIREFNASKRDPSKRLPYIVVVIDEFADFILREKHASASQKKRNTIMNAARRESAIQRARRAAKQGLEDLPDVSDVEEEMSAQDLIVRLAQMARAVGIHLIIATQRPSTDVITGLIKANFPTRVALTTASPTDSVVILGVPGAEKLSGKGDMIFMSPGLKGLQRLQGFMA